MPVQANFSPSATQEALGFSHQTFACIQDANCNLPGQPTGQMVGYAGSVFVLLGVILIVLASSLLYAALFYKKENIVKNKEVDDENLNKVQDLPIVESKEEVIVSTDSNKKDSPKKSLEKAKPTFKAKKSEQAPPVVSGKRKSSDFAALAGSDDVLSTQLDLARIYVDIGSEREARKILKNILEKGSEEQQLTAKNLMKKIEKETA